jgi:DNA-binding beta-propeller fold protein YncE
VQKNGNFLFVAHKDLNQINVLNKTTGALVQTLSFTAPREVCVDPSGNLWVISGSNTIQKFTVNNNGTLSSAILSISGISEPLAMAVSPNGSKIFILDGAASQQVKIFDNSTSASISTFGSAGGYINNASVNDYKFYFSDSVTELSKPFIAFQSDSSYWLGDVGNERVQHYNASGTFINRICVYRTPTLLWSTAITPTEYLTNTSNFMSTIPSHWRQIMGRGPW